MLSSIMGIALLVTSCLMFNIYIKYCNFLNDQSDPPDHYNYYDYPDSCGDDEAHFIVLPLLGFATMAAWVRYCYCEKV